MMTPEETQLAHQFLATFQKIAERPYSLTGAIDWPMFVFMFGLLGTFISTVVVAVWWSLKEMLKVLKLELSTLNGKIAGVQTELHECQDECCYAGEERRKHNQGRAEGERRGSR